MLEGKQTGYLWTTAGVNGLYIEVLGEYSVTFRRILNGQLDDREGHAIVREVYDERQGNMVTGIELTDVVGKPTGEVYKLRDFQLSGNVRYVEGWGW